MTETNLPAVNQMAQSLDRRIREAAYTIYGLGREIGHALLVIQREELYKELGHESFASYIADLPFSRTTAIRLKENYRVFIEERQLPPETYDQIDSNKLEIIRNKVNKENFEELIERARILTREDLRISFQEEEARTPYPHVWLCHDCKKWAFSLHVDEVCPEIIKRIKQELEGQDN